MSKTVLVVDDDPDILDVVKTYLADESLNVATVTGAHEALLYLKEAVPHLILLDISLPPGPDGFHLLEMLRNKPSLQQLPVVMLTAQGGSSFILRAQELKANDYLMKPFTGDELSEMVRKYI